MPIEIVAPPDAGRLAPLYNRLAAGAPFCPPVSDEAFVAGMTYRESDSLLDQRLIVASDGGAVVGFAHFGVEPASERVASPRGVLRFLLYEASERAAGQALLDAVHSAARENGLTSVRAFTHQHTYRFHHLGFGLLSDRLLHVSALFGANGYRTRDDGWYDQEVFLMRRDDDSDCPTNPDPNAAVEIETTTGRGQRPGLALRLIRDGELIGECDSCSVGDYVDDAESQETFFTVWLGIEERERGSGWGRYLLRRARWEMRRLGYRHAVISTNTKNYRAQLLYSSEGYRVVDCAYGYEKRFDT